MPKIIYAIRNTSHFSYHESSINAILASKSDLLIVFDEYWSNYGHPNTTALDNWRRKNPEVNIEYFPGRKGRLRNPLIFLRELRSYNSYCRRGDDYEFYRNRWANYLKLPKKLHNIVTAKKIRPIMGSALLRKFLTLIERLAPPDQNIMGWLHSKQPDVLVASPCNMRYSQELELVKAAKRMGIPTVIPVLSWDNTSTKGLFHIHPTRVLAWHDGHRNDCIKYHGIPEKKIVIVGSPFFDKWFDKQSDAITREEFCKQVGLDPARPYVLYLGSSANIAADETWLVRDMNDALKSSGNSALQNTQILFRSHPANWQNGLKLLDNGIGVWPREGTLPDSEETFKDFYNSLTHASCVVGLNTSGMLDALIMNKPVISPLIERYRLTQEKAEHFMRMRDNNTLYVAANVAEILQYIAALSAGDDPLAGKRRSFIEKFVRPCGIDKSAGARVTKEILAVVTAKKPALLVKPWNGKSPKKAKILPLSAKQSKTAGHHKADTAIEAVLANFAQTVEREKNSELYNFYKITRDKIISMVSSYKMSRYWYEEVMGFDYLFDASPILVSKIREHCYHITGERSYTYRTHHSHKAPPFIARLNDLRAIDNSNLFVPESEACGGFGYESPYGKINLDTLKFYEVLIGLDRANFLAQFKNDQTSRKAVVEIGSGWGGFAYQFNTLFKNTTFFCIDLPATLIFSTTYIRGACPDAKIAILGDMPNDELFKRWQEFDFVFIPANKLEDFKPLQLDLAVNMCSFQEMTTEQVAGYVNHLANVGCKKLYSLNRDRSHHNPELSLVSDLMRTRYDLTPISVLPTEYCTVGTKLKAKTKTTIEEANNTSAYRHFSGILR